MRIVIDMQGAQSSGSRQRGIGRYTLWLVKAIAAQRGEHQIFLALNGLFPESIEPIRSALDGLLPQSNIRVWDAPSPVNYAEDANRWRRKTAELVREAFLGSLRPDVVLVTSVFEGLGDDAVTSVSLLSHAWPTAAILYDLIPLLNRSPYLDNPVVEEWYENKLDHVRRADLLLAISESSRREAIDHLGFPGDLVVNISSAADSRFCESALDKGAEMAVRERYGLHRPFVLYTGGIDHRKNVEGLIRAYASLPGAVRLAHQLSIVCTIEDTQRAALESLARAHNLGEDELVLTGFVTDEDLLSLYNLCKVFVFPSWHEGFGLPALEAMSCGKAVIAANTSSLPEVIGREDALFDPHDDQAIAEKLQDVLTDDAFRTELERHGSYQARRFSWETSAQRAIEALETLHARRSPSKSGNCRSVRRPTLAFISPLPPERSGISDYSAQLLPDLARYYEIEIIAAQEAVSHPWIRANCAIRTVEWFRSNARRFDRVLYHFGNSRFHKHMFGLLGEFPGTVVMHDFFLSHIVADMDVSGVASQHLTNELYHAHGYKALADRASTADLAEFIWRYPCNRSVLERARGVIVHSDYACRLAHSWYGEESTADWAVVPLLRASPPEIDRSDARRMLNIAPGDFVVCCFGMGGPTKLNHRLLKAWLDSSLGMDRHCFLVFVGEQDVGEYGAALLQTLRANPAAGRVSITGWLESSRFRQYLAAADVAVQLRTLSRGETSAAVLDCMNYGLATIINANGGMADLPDDALYKLADEFDDADLVGALEALWTKPAKRRELGARAREIIRSQYAPRICADLYFEAIERAYSNGATDVMGLAAAIARMDPRAGEDVSLVPVASAIARSIGTQVRQRQLFVDVSELALVDAKSGIQRVVRSIVKQLLTHPPSGYRVEPVYSSGAQGYRYARNFTLAFLGIPEVVLRDDPVDIAANDVFLGLDLSPEVVPAQRLYYQALRQRGVRVFFVVYDLLCIHTPERFSTELVSAFHNWLEVVLESDGALCISKAVADELADWVKDNAPLRDRPCQINWFHLGSDIENSAPSKGLPPDAKTVLSALRVRPTFTMVGTLEPRKAHIQVLEAFEALWRSGVDVNLAIVGKQGWMVEPLAARLRKHPELGKRLYWLDAISDEYLQEVYASSTCLIAASCAEGFGLPLIEAARQKLPVVARDIPVFREVAGDHAFYFSGTSSQSLAEALGEWLRLNAEGLAPSSEGIQWLTWAESTRRLLHLLLAEAEPGGGQREIMNSAVLRSV